MPKQQRSLWHAAATTRIDVQVDLRANMFGNHPPAASSARGREESHLLDELAQPPQQPDFSASTRLDSISSAPLRDSAASGPTGPAPATTREVQWRNSAALHQQALSISPALTVPIRAQHTPTLASARNHYGLNQPPPSQPSSRSHHSLVQGDDAVLEEALLELSPEFSPSSSSPPTSSSPTAAPSSPPSTVDRRFLDSYTRIRQEQERIKLEMRERLSRRASTVPHHADVALTAEQSTSRTPLPSRIAASGTFWDQQNLVISAAESPRHLRLPTTNNTGNRGYDDADSNDYHSDDDDDSGNDDNNGHDHDDHNDHNDNNQTQPGGGTRGGRVLYDRQDWAAGRNNAATDRSSTFGRARITPSSTSPPNGASLDRGRLLFRNDVDSLSVGAGFTSTAGPATTGARRWSPGHSANTVCSHDSETTTAPAAALLRPPPPLPAPFRGRSGGASAGSDGAPAFSSSNIDSLLASVSELIAKAQSQDAWEIPLPTTAFEPAVPRRALVLGASASNRNGSGSGGAVQFHPAGASSRRQEPSEGQGVGAARDDRRLAVHIDTHSSSSSSSSGSSSSSSSINAIAQPSLNRAYTTQQRMRSSAVDSVASRQPQDSRLPRQVSAAALRHDVRASLQQDLASALFRVFVTASRDNGEHTVGARVRRGCLCVCLLKSMVCRCLRQHCGCCRER
jgi:hypothetical protein